MTNSQTNSNGGAMPHPRLWPLTARMDSAGRLQVAGVDVAALARTAGTPLYLYDEATIRAQCQTFRAAFESRWPSSGVAYAGKAYLSPTLCALLADEGLELDAVSAGEVGVALAARYPAARIHLHGNVKPDAELAYALDEGVGRIVVDSLEEVERLGALASQRRRHVAIWLRVNPDVATETHAYTQTGHAASKFGLDLAGGVAAEAAQRAHASDWLDLVGLHAHAGSHLFDVQPAARVVQALVDFAATLRERDGIEIGEISPGGGLAVAYTPEQQEPSLDEYAAAVTDALAATVARSRLAPPRLVVEPGRAIVARAGIAIYRVGPRKLAPDGSVLVAVDGGMGDNPRPALYAAKYHAALIERLDEPPTEIARIVGRYCESGDFLAESVALPTARAGDLLAIPVSGAYHMSMASNYNFVARPAVYFVHDGVARLARRRETLADLLALEEC